MTVRVRLGPAEASVSAGQWTSPVPELTDVLALMTRYIERASWDADFDYVLAQHAVKRFGGAIIAADPSEHVPGRIY